MSKNAPVTEADHDDLFASLWSIVSLFQEFVQGLALDEETREQLRQAIDKNTGAEASRTNYRDSAHCARCGLPFDVELSVSVSAKSMTLESEVVDVTCPECGCVNVAEVASYIVMMEKEGG